MNVMEALQVAYTQNPEGNLPLPKALELAKLEKLSNNTPRELELIGIIGNLWKQLHYKDAVLNALMCAEIREGTENALGMEVQPHHVELAKDILRENGITD